METCEPQQLWFHGLYDDFVLFFPSASSTFTCFPSESGTTVDDWAGTELLLSVFRHIICRPKFKGALCGFKRMNSEVRMSVFTLLIWQICIFYITD